MPDSFLHERSDFKALVATVADSEKINDPALVEKDYWIMHAVFGLKQLGLTFELKGGTSLSKGFGIIQRFSEDIDIRIEPFDGLQVDTNPNHEKPQHIESRRQFYEKLRDKIKIPGITSVERDTTYDDETLRNAGLRLSYETHFGSIAGLKDGILLEVGFDQTAPNRAVTISSWIVQFAEAKKLQYTDNRALEIPCYNPEYTFVEKVQAVVRKYGQFKGTGKIPNEFPQTLLRHPPTSRRGSRAEIHRNPRILAAQEEALQVFGSRRSKKRSFHDRRPEHSEAIRRGIFKDGSTLLSRPDSIGHNSRPHPERPRASMRAVHPGLKAVKFASFNSARTDRPEPHDI